MDYGIKTGGGHLLGTCSTYFMTHWDYFKKIEGCQYFWSYLQVHKIEAYCRKQQQKFEKYPEMQVHKWPAFSNFHKSQNFSYTFKETEFHLAKLKNGMCLWAFHINHIKFATWIFFHFNRAVLVIVNFAR